MEILKIKKKDCFAMGLQIPADVLGQLRRIQLWRMRALYPLTPSPIYPLAIATYALMCVV